MDQHHRNLSDSTNGGNTDPPPETHEENNTGDFENMEMVLSFISLVLLEEDEEPLNESSELQEAEKSLSVVIARPSQTGDLGGIPSNTGDFGGIPSHTGDSGGSYALSECENLLVGLVTRHSSLYSLSI